MFSSGPNYAKLKTNLRLAVSRLKLLEKKKTELGQKARKEIGDYIAEGKYERAKIRVEQIIREDYLVEAMELVEMYCDLILSRFGLLQTMKDLDPSLAEPISSILWVTPRLSSEVIELKAISDQLSNKYGRKYAEVCKDAGVDTISEKLKHKLSLQAPPKILIEKYLIEIAKIYNIPYEPDPQVLREHEQARGMDALLFDGISNDLDGKITRPPGFVDYPPPPAVPNFQPFNYPQFNPSPQAPSLPPKVMPDTPPFAYNIPPSEGVTYDTSKPINSPPPYTELPSDNNKQSNEQPKPLPRSKMSPDLNLPELPSVPADDFPEEDKNDADDEDFIDIARRFEELTKRNNKPK